MASPGSVTHWIGLLKAGDAAAAQRLWDRFFDRLVSLAQAQLRGLPRGPADEEDVALSAFNRFCLAVRRGQFPRLEDRDDLWQLLALLTERKVCDRPTLLRPLPLPPGSRSSSIPCRRTENQGQLTHPHLAATTSPGEAGWRVMSRRAVGQIGNPSSSRPSQQRTDW
jgi:hypothetical protein